jgi:hypothetical protein
MTFDYMQTGNESENEKSLLKFVPKYIELKEIMSECIGYKMKKPEKVE